jgi:hypothetical protein
MPKTAYDEKMEIVAAIKDKIVYQAEIAHKAANVVADHLIEVIDQHLGGGDLQKLAGPRGLLKSANANARAEMESLKKLQAECVQAQAVANEEFSSYAAHLVGMIAQAPASADTTRYFSVIKGGKVTPLETPAAPNKIDLNRALFDSQMARRFQDLDEQKP